jgi:hypothetical protein
MRSLWLGLGGFCRGNSRFPISSDQQKVAANNPGFSLPASHFWLPHFWLLTSGFSLKLFCALLETTNRFDS